MRVDLKPFAFAACVVPSLAVAQTADFDGAWTLGDPTRCVFGLDDPNLFMRIENGLLRGYESICRLTDATPIRGMSAVLFDAACEGEGDVWTQRVLLMREDPDQLIELRDGYALRYRRCVDFTPLDSGSPTSPGTPPSK